MEADSQTETSSKPNNAGPKEYRAQSRMIVFLVCFAISVLMWLYVELQKDYTDEIKYNITFINSPKDLILTKSGDNVIKVGINAQGIELLIAKYTHKMRTLTIDLSTLRMRQTGDGYTSYIPSSGIIEQLGTQIRFKKEIIFIKPDTLFFQFSKVYSAQVPVRLDMDYTLDGQYDIIDSISYKPRFITVSSTKNIIDTLKFVSTQKLSLNQLDSSIRLKVAIFKGSNSNLLNYSSDSVTVNLNIERVTEEGFTVPIHVAGDSENMKLFPEKVEVTCRVPLSEYRHIEATDFLAQVEYKSSLIKEKTLKVKLAKIPNKVRVIKIAPEEVEYIIISK